MTTLNPQRLVPAKIPKVITYLPEDLKKDLDALAKAESRTLSNMLKVLVEEAVAKAKEEGRIPKTQQKDAGKED